MRGQAWEGQRCFLLLLLPDQQREKQRGLPLRTGWRQWRGQAGAGGAESWRGTGLVAVRHCWPCCRPSGSCRLREVRRGAPCLMGLVEALVSGVMAFGVWCLMGLVKVLGVPVWCLRREIRRGVSCLIGLVVVLGVMAFGAIGALVQRVMVLGVVLRRVVMIRELQERPLWSCAAAAALGGAGGAAAGSAAGGSVGLAAAAGAAAVGTAAAAVPGPRAASAHLPGPSPLAQQPLLLPLRQRTSRGQAPGSHLRLLVVVLLLQLTAEVPHVQLLMQGSHLLLHRCHCEPRRDERLRSQ